MRILRNVFFLVILAPALLGQVAAQTNPCLDQIIPVSSSSEEDQPVPGLAAQNFVAKVGGKQVPTVSATYDTTPRRVVILIDHSQSMQKNGQVDLELAVAQALVSASQPQDSYAVLTFNENVEYMVHFGLDRDTVLAEIGGHMHATRASGGTALYDALARATDLLRPAHIGDSVYMMSDGEDDASRLTEVKAAEVVAGAGVRIYGSC